MRPYFVLEQNDPTGELANGGQGLRVTLGIHCCPALQEVYQKGAVLVKDERQQNLSYTCVDGLGYFW